MSATRKRAPAEKRDERLLLASIGKDATVDLLEAVESNILDVPELQRGEAWSLQCVRVARVEDDVIAMVFATDVSGEREVVHDGEDPTRPVLWAKGQTDVTRVFSCGLLCRPASGDSGILLLHSPWRRGGSKSAVLTLLQRAVNQVPEAKAKLHADPMIPAKALKRMLERADSTRITYTKTKGITSSFDEAGQAASARAEMELVVKGSNSIPFRDALKAALRASANKDKFFTVRMRNQDGEYEDETFDDVTIDLDTAAGVKRYSLRNETIPTMSFDQTGNIDSVYFGLSEDDPGGWPDEILQDVSPLLVSVAKVVQQDS